MDNIQRLEEQAVLPQIDQETIDKAIQTIQELADVIVDVWQKVVEVVTSAFDAFWEALKEFLKQVNPKIYNLAYHHKKNRVRKKNKKKLFLLFRRGVKWIIYRNWNNKQICFFKTLQGGSSQLSTALENE